MKLVLILACTLCLTLVGTLFAFGRTTPGESYAAYADAVQHATSCEFASCGCLGLKCSCFDCGGCGGGSSSSGGSGSSSGK